jgi:hypothetical protein
LDKDHKVSLVQCNPVFDTDNYSLRLISPLIPTVGVRDAEDLPTSLGFARFAEGTASLAELEAYLGRCVSDFLHRLPVEPEGDTAAGALAPYADVAGEVDEPVI